jgi:hypothetical protein
MGPRPPPPPELPKLKYNYHRYNYLPLSASSLHLEMGREEGRPQELLATAAAQAFITDTTTNKTTIMLPVIQMNSLFFPAKKIHPCGLADRISSLLMLARFFRVILLTEFLPVLLLTGF